MSKQIIHEDLSKEKSQEYLDLFQKLEYQNRVPSTDWDGGENANSYIWLVDVTDGSKIPIGFIGYDTLALPNGEEFIYIVKFFVFGKYKKYCNQGDVKLVEGEKVSSLLFKEVKSKGKSIITLTSASKKLDTYYQKEYGFIYDEKISEKLASIVGVFSDGFLYLDLESEKSSSKIKDMPKNLFG